MTRLEHPIQYLTEDQLHQHRRFPSAGSVVNYNNLNVPAIMYGSDSELVQLILTPVVNCFWEVVAHSTWNSPDGIWSAMRTQLEIDPADVDGKTYGAQLGAHVHASVPGFCPITNIEDFKLEAGTEYTVSLYAYYSPGYNQGHWSGGEHLGIEGHTYAHGCF